SWVVLGRLGSSCVVLRRLCIIIIFVFFYSIEIDQKLQEIIKQTGYLLIGGQRYQADINDLENLGEIGSGTCGQVWKMKFKKTGHVIAVKQMRRSGNKEENKRILMDLDVVLKSHDCPYIVQCFGTFITNVRPSNDPIHLPHQ
ncbi:hypothetical protein FKM82_030555, partial [Ascaphus truei]